MTAWRWLDSVIAVRAPARVLTELQTLLGAPSVDGTTAEVVVGTDGAVLVDGAELLPAGDPLEGALSGLNAAALAGVQGFAVHAGVVRLPRVGAAVAFPAVSGAGKSTLTVACVLGGAGYLSDEALVVPWGGGAVRAYRRPVGLSPWSLAVLGLDVTVHGTEGHVPAQDIDPLPASGAHPSGAVLAHIVLPRRGHDGPPVLTPLDRAHAAEVLLRRSFNHWTDPRSAFLTAAGLARGARCWTLDYGDPRGGARCVLETLGDG
ncbi:MAG: hypothetical protein JWL64_1284 [Frankiales bacterium]|nr:hypothetical protein [Frankiales bacterium]